MVSENGKSIGQIYHNAKATGQDGAIVLKTLTNLLNELEGNNNV